MARLRNGVKTSMRRRKRPFWPLKALTRKMWSEKLKVEADELIFWGKDLTIKAKKKVRLCLFGRFFVASGVEWSAEAAIRISNTALFWFWNILDQFIFFVVHLWSHLLHHCIFSYFRRFSCVFVLNSGSQRFCNYLTWRRYGFVEFKNEEDADYAIKIMNMIRLGQNVTGLIGTNSKQVWHSTAGMHFSWYQEVPCLPSTFFIHLSSVYGLGSVDE